MTIFQAGAPRPLPRGAIVAEVQVYGAREGGRVEARVRRMIQGPRGARLLIIRPYPDHVCHVPVPNGARGIIVATPVASERGVPIVRVGLRTDVPRRR